MPKGLQRVKGRTLGGNTKAGAAERPQSWEKSRPLPFPHTAGTLIKNNKVMPKQG